jgi:hypothetical protein
MRHVALHWAGIAGAVACTLLLGSCTESFMYGSDTVGIRAEGTADQVKKFDTDVRSRFGPNGFKCFEVTDAATLDCTPGITGSPTVLGYVFSGTPKQVMSTVGDIFSPVTLTVGPATGCPTGCTCNPGCPGFHAPYCMKIDTHCTAC